MLLLSSHFDGKAHGLFLFSPPKKAVPQYQRHDFQASDKCLQNNKFVFSVKE